MRSVPGEATVHVPGFTPAMGRKLVELIDATLTALANGDIELRPAPPRRSKAKAK